jgi:preprotein translocase subunit SecE
MNRIKQFFEEARTEFRHVNWPTRSEAVRLTGVVIALSVGIAVFLGAFDYLFTFGLKYFVSTFVQG